MCECFVKRIRVTDEVIRDKSGNPKITEHIRLALVIYFAKREEI